MRITLEDKELVKKLKIRQHLAVAAICLLNIVIFGPLVLFFAVKQESVNAAAFILAGSVIALLLEIQFLTKHGILKVGGK